MELATLTSKGQITLPIQIRRKLRLSQGDKVIFFEDCGRIVLQNSNAVTLAHFQSAMRGAADEAGFGQPDDVQAYIKSLRREKGQKHASRHG